MNTAHSLSPDVSICDYFLGLGPFTGAMPELPEIYSSERTFHHAASQLEQQGIKVYGARLLSLWHDPTKPKAPKGDASVVSSYDNGDDGDEDDEEEALSEEEIDEQEDSMHDTSEGCVVELTASDAPRVKRGSGTVSQSHVYPPLPGTCPTLADRDRISEANKRISQQNAKKRRIAKADKSKFVKTPFEELPYTPIPQEHLQSLVLSKVTYTPRTLLIHFSLMIVQVRIYIIFLSVFANFSSNHNASDPVPPPYVPSSLHSTSVGTSEACSTQG